MRTMYRFHASPTSSDETATVRHRAASSPSASWAQTRSIRNSRRPRAASGDDDMAWTWFTNDCPGCPGPASHCARNASTRRTPGEAGSVRTSFRICRGSAGRLTVDPYRVALSVK